MKPISDLIEDIQKKQNLEKALTEYLIRPGCNHPRAYNYNKRATQDDGTCEDPSIGEDLTFPEDGYSYSSWIKIYSIILFLTIVVLFEIFI